MNLPNRRLPFIVTTDASKIGIGAVLSQIENGEEKLIAFYSDTNNRAETNYSTTEQELFAIVRKLKHFRHYLMGQKFTLKTDHKILTYLKIKKTILIILANHSAVII